MLATAGSATRRSAERGTPRKFKRRRQDAQAAMSSSQADELRMTEWLDPTQAGKRWEAMWSFKCAA
jgi:hypothetical protein